MGEKGKEGGVERRSKVGGSWSELLVDHGRPVYYFTLTDFHYDWLTTMIDVTSTRGLRAERARVLPSLISFTVYCGKHTTGNSVGKKEKKSFVAASSRCLLEHAAEER